MVYNIYFYDRERDAIFRVKMLTVMMTGRLLLRT